MYPSYPNSNAKSSDTSVPSATGIRTVSSSNPHPAHHHDRDKHKSIMPAAPPYNFPPSEAEPWNSGICDCFSDMKSCCLTLFCPCVTFGQIAEIVDKGAISCGVNGAIYTMINCVTGCACMYSCIYRTKLRSQFYLEERPCFDCLVHFFCEPCALCQEYRELQSRGFNMAIGWRGNMDGRNYEMAMAPIPRAVEAGMSRK